MSIDTHIYIYNHIFCHVCIRHIPASQREEEMLPQVRTDDALEQLLQLNSGTRTGSIAVSSSHHQAGIQRMQAYPLAPSRPRGCEDQWRQLELKRSLKFKLRVLESSEFSYSGFDNQSVNEWNNQKQQNRKTHKSCNLCMIACCHRIRTVPHSRTQARWRVSRSTWI